MAKIELPPLTPNEILERDHEEYRLNKEISKSWRGEDFDSERAYKVLRAYVVVIFDTLFAIYQKKPGFRTSWLAGIVQESVHRTLVVYTGHDVYGMPSLNEIGSNLRATIMGHVRNDPGLMIATGLAETIQITPQQTSIYAKSGIDAASASPLLKMVMAHTSRPSVQQPQRNSREVVVLPLLEKKGWSVFEWATESGVSYHTADDYLKGKRAQYRSTIKKLAESLGLSVQELPR